MGDYWGTIIITIIIIIIIVIITTQELQAALHLLASVNASVLCQ